MHNNLHFSIKWFFIKIILSLKIDSSKYSNCSFNAKDLDSSFLDKMIEMRILIFILFKTHLRGVHFFVRRLIKVIASVKIYKKKVKSQKINHRKEIKSFKRKNNIFGAAAENNIKII
jgi:hypothetical protein